MKVVRPKLGRTVLCVSSLALLIAGSSLTTRAQYAQPPQRISNGNALSPILKDVRIEQKLGAQIPLDTLFRDETGQAVKIGDYFKGQRPVVFALVYYNCPRLCNQILSGMIGGLRGVSFTPGKDFDVVVLSFDPRERPEDAAKKKHIVLADYHRLDTAAGWHFLTGDKAAIDTVADAVGFHYAYDPATEQFAHMSAIMLATPQGRLSHYFYGIEYDPKDLRLGLVEASAGRIGSPVDQLALYCYHYDPTTGRYGPVIMNIMRLGGILMVLLVLALILFLRRYRPRSAETAGGMA